MKDREEKPDVPAVEEQPVKPEDQVPDAWTQTTRDPNTGSLMTEETPDAEAH